MISPVHTLDMDPGATTRSMARRAIFSSSKILRLMAKMNIPIVIVDNLRMGCYSWLNLIWQERNWFWVIIAVLVSEGHQLVYLGGIWEIYVVWICWNSDCWNLISEMVLIYMRLLGPHWDWFPLVWKWLNLFPLVLHSLQFQVSPNIPSIISAINISHIHVACIKIVFLPDVIDSPALIRRIKLRMAFRPNL